MTTPHRDAIPAATLVIVRDAAPGALPELLMLERARTMAFAGGALVFPGGRVDAADRAFAAARGATDIDEDAARLAAIRETIEEAGLAIGLYPGPDGRSLAAIRDDLARGRSLAEALDQAGCELDLAVLEPFARWRPDGSAARIYDTRFYLARLPDDAPEASVDATENVRLFWATAHAVLADADAGRASLIYPTRRNLERLALFADHAAAVADARAHPVRTITPFVRDAEGVSHLCIPDDLGYPVTAEPMTAVRRG